MSSLETVQSLYRLCLANGFNSVDEAASAIGMKNRTMREWCSKDAYRPILEKKLSQASSLRLTDKAESL